MKSKRYITKNDVHKVDCYRWEEADEQIISDLYVATVLIYLKSGDIFYFPNVYMDETDFAKHMDSIIATIQKGKTCYLDDAWMPCKTWPPKLV